MGTTYLTDGDDLTSVANAIRAKSGGSSQLAFPAGFVNEIQAIPSGGGTLPDEYQEVEYVGNTGTGIIVTDVVLLSPILVECEMSLSSTPSSTGFLFAFSDFSGGWIGVNSSGILTLGGGQNFSVIATNRNEFSATFETSNNFASVTAVVNDQTKSRSGSRSISGAFLSFFGKSSDSFNCASRLYGHAKIYSQGNQIREYVPCYRKSDGKIGVFCTMEQIFFPISSNGEKGQDVLSAQQALNVLLGGAT